MTPVAGTDCFVVLRCTEIGDGCSVAGTTPGVLDRDQYPIQVFIDNDGYVWVAVVQYAEGPSSSHVPYWISLHKSKEVLDCDEVKAAGDDGFTPVGSGFTSWFEFVCDGAHADWADSDCSLPTTTPMFDVDFIGVTFYNSKFGCCLGFSDPCNPIPDGACDGAGDNCEHCSNCDDGIAPAFMLFEIDRGYAPLAYADGTFLLSIYPEPCVDPAHECSWVGCFEVLDPGPNAIRSIKIVAELEPWAGGNDPQFTVFHYTSADCSGTCVFNEIDGTGFENAGTDCLNVDYTWNPPPGYALVSCTGGAVPIPTWSPYVRLRAL